MIPSRIVIGLLIGAIALLLAIPTPHGLTVSFFDVGEGDSILINGPTGIQVLIDGGPDGSVLRELGTALPFWDRSLDAVIATHAVAADTAGLVDVLSRYRVKMFIRSDGQADSATSAVLASAVQTNGARQVVATAGMRLLLGKGAYADIISADPSSLVIRVGYGATSFLLMGDAPIQEQKKLSLTTADVLLVPHHGAPTSTSPTLLDMVQPTYAVISVAKDNQYDYPSADTLSLLTDSGIKVLSTADGTIVFHSDGMTLRAER